MMSRDGVQPPPPAPIEIAVPRMRVQLRFLGRSTGRSTGRSLRAPGALPTRRGRVWAHKVGKPIALVTTRTRMLVTFLMEKQFMRDGRAARNIDHLNHA